LEDPWQEIPGIPDVFAVIVEVPIVKMRTLLFVTRKGTLLCRDAADMAISTAEFSTRIAKALFEVPVLPVIVTNDCSSEDAPLHVTVRSEIVTEPEATLHSITNDLIVERLELTIGRGNPDL
jgi:hypothetical protein